MNPLLGGLLKHGGSAALGAGVLFGLDKLFGGPEAPASPAAATPGSTPTPQNQAAQRQQELEFIAALIREQNALARSQSEAAAGELAADRRLREKLQMAAMDPQLYAQRAAIDLDTYKRQQELARQAGMEQTRELTRRKIESDTIMAWKGITEAQINRDATLGLGMMQLAYTAGMPNPNVLQGGAALAGQGRASFGTPSSTIS